MAHNDRNSDIDDDTDDAAERKRSPRELLFDWMNRAQFVIYTVLVLVLLLCGFLWPRVFISIPPGSSGVTYEFLGGGTNTEHIRGEGLNIIFPWDKIFIYETRLQHQSLKFDVLSGEGLSLSVEVVVRYRPRLDMLGHLHKDIGPEYFERLVKPEVQSHVRRTFGNRPAQEIYASVRDVLQELGRVPVLGKLDEAEGESAARAYVQILELKLVHVDLPTVVVGAIAEKYRQQQLMLEYEYKLKREEQEAERKRTEAAGIRDYNIIASRVSPDLLRWRGVDATLELAKSQNSKVIVLGGGGQGGIPMLMNLADGASGPLAAAPADQQAAGLGLQAPDKREAPAAPPAPANNNAPANAPPANASQPAPAAPAAP